MNEPVKEIKIYTDGASRGNPGRGGYGAILIWGNIKKELSQGYRLTTNNRMELMAVIAALEALKKITLTWLFTLIVIMWLKLLWKDGLPNG